MFFRQFANIVLEMDFGVFMFFCLIWTLQGFFPFMISHPPKGKNCIPCKIDSNNLRTRHSFSLLKKKYIGLAVVSE